MSLLILKDRGGNGDQYCLRVHGKMDTWKMASFLEYIETRNESLKEEGFVVEPLDKLHFETFRQMATRPALSLNLPLVFSQGDRVLKEDDRIDLSEQVNIVHLDRDSHGTVPDSSRISVAEINKAAFSSCRRTICTAFDSLFDFEKFEISTKDGHRINSIAELINDFAETLSEESQLRFFLRVAMLIHSAPFENISKILGSISLRSGYEMWGNIAGSFGGVCAEKTSMLKFICDILSVNTTPVIGSDEVIHSDFEKKLKDYVDSDGQAELPIWIQHHLLEIDICGTSYLVDTTGGNIPLAFLEKADADMMINNGIRARMVYRVDRLNLARTSNWVGDTLLTLSQYHVRELHMQYVFKQGLGLHIDSELFIAVFFDWGGERSAMMQNYYASLAKRVGFTPPRFVHANNLCSVPDEALKSILFKTLTALRVMYNDRHYTGDFTFVIQPLAPNFWRQPRLSSALKKISFGVLNG